MPENDNNPTDPGKKVATPDAGKNVTPEQVTKIVADALSAALAPFAETIGTLSKTVNAVAADKRRAAKKPDPKSEESEDGEPVEEIATLRDEVKTLRIEREADRKRLALKDALDAHSETLAGRKHLEKLIGADLAIDSTGQVVAVQDGKHVALKDYVKTFADDPQWQKPTGTNGGGKPEASGARNSNQPKTVDIHDHNAVAANFDAIADGSVTAVI